MSLKVYPQMEQRSEQWYEARRGIVTASMVGSLITTGPPSATAVECPRCGVIADSPCVSVAKGGFGAPIKNLHPERHDAVAALPPVLKVADNDTSARVTAVLAAERIAGFTEDTPTTSDMWRGIEAEPHARDAYAAHNASVREVGFMVEDKWGFSIGYSPDGLVGKDGLIEVKAPRAKGHVLAVINDEVPAYNMAQLQTGLLVSGRKWVDYIPYVGGLPLWSKRVHPDPAWQAAILAAVANFETTAAQMVAAYNTATEGLPTTERLPDLYAAELRLA